MDIEKLSQLLESHHEWISSEGESGNQANFENLDLQQMVFENVDLSYAIFKNANLTRSIFKNVKLTSCDFTNTNLSYVKSENSDFSHSNLSLADFDGAKINHSSFEYSTLNKTNFYNTRLYKANFGFAKGEKTKFVNADLTASEFEESKFEKPDFNRANITNTSFINAEIIEGNIERAIGITKVFQIKEDESQKENFISSNAQIKLFRQVSLGFFSISGILTFIIAVLGVLNIYQMIVQNIYLSVEINYFSWIILIMIFVLLGVYSRYMMYKIRKEDLIKLAKEENV